MIAETLSHLQLHTGKLFAAWILGTVTWVSQATNYIGLLGAFVGCFAGVMLVCIRWDDFVNSKPITRLRTWWSGTK